MMADGRVSSSRFRLVRCEHDQAEGGLSGAWFILGGDLGEECHSGYAYSNREEAKSDLRLRRWLDQALITQIKRGSSEPKSARSARHPPVPRYLHR